MQTSMCNHFFFFALSYWEEPSNFLMSTFLSGLGIRSFYFRANRSFFVKKWANERFTHLLIWFPSKSLVFCQKMSEWAIHSKKWVIHSFAHFWWAKWAIPSHCSFPMSNLSELLMVAPFWWAKWAIHSHCSFDLSHMSDSLTLLTQKRGNEQKWAIRSFLRNFL